MSKSALQQVIDELSLDFANGKYLNIISANYGLNRPLFGFNDDLWRAVTKVVALQYKQIANKFADVVELILGPKVSQCSGLLVDANIGDTALIAHNCSTFPQVGILILDKGTPEEEQIAYRFIDYQSNTIFLTAELQFEHKAVNQNVESLVLLGDSGTTTLILENSELFSVPTNPYVVTLGRGTSTEETVTVVDRSISNRSLTISDPLSNSYKAEVFNLEKTQLSTDYVTGSFYLTVTNSDFFPDTGVLLLSRASNIFTVGGGSTTTNVVLPASTFSSVNTLSGYNIHFDGNITAALENYETFIAGNTLSSLSFISALPMAPASGDTFSISPVVQFTGKSSETLNLKYVIQSDLVLSSGTTVESYKYFPTATISTVLVQGISWDIFQSTPNLVEIVIPFDDSQLQTLKSASYVHTESLVATTSLSSAASIGDSIINVTNGVSFPESGQLVIDIGLLDEEVAGYVKISNTQFRIPYLLETAHLSSASVDFDNYTYSGSNILKGGVSPPEYIFPGPYIYDTTDYGPVINTNTVLTQNLAPQTMLALDVLAGAGPKAVEVVDANLFPLSGTFTAILEDETLTVTAVSLKTRSQSQLNGAHSVSATVLNVFGGTLGTVQPGAAFPNANGYRIRVGRGTANVEICYVVSINTGGNTITISPGLQKSHAHGDLIDLISDTLTVSQLDFGHTGIVGYANRVPINTTTVPEAEIPSFDYIGAEKLHIPYSSITISNGANYPLDGGIVILEHGDTKNPTDFLVSAVAVDAFTLPLVNSNNFPTVYPFFVRIAPGSRFEEIVAIDNNNTGTDILTLYTPAGYGDLKYAHPAGTVVEFISGDVEVIPYVSRSSNTLTLAAPTMVKYPHQVNNKITLGQLNNPPTNGNGYPLRMPPNYFERLEYLLDIIRAAGVELRIIRVS